MESQKIHVFCDFDGTITNRDSIVAFTEDLGGGKQYRRRIIDKVKEGSLSNYECIRQELASVKASWEEAQEYLRAHISIDPEFAPFVQWCRQLDYSVSVVSSGIEQVIAFFLGSLDIPCFAHEVEMNPEGWVYRKRENNDKARILGAAAREVRTVFVGDGTSDIMAIPFADVLFAKTYLAEYCTARGHSFVPFESFRDVRDRLPAVLEAIS